MSETIANQTLYKRLQRQLTFLNVYQYHFKFRKGKLKIFINPCVKFKKESSTLNRLYFNHLLILKACHFFSQVTKWRTKLELPLVAFKKNTSWACASIIRLRVPTVSGDMSTVGSRFKADKTVSLICKKAPLAN